MGLGSDLLRIFRRQGIEVMTTRAALEVTDPHIWTTLIKRMRTREDALATFHCLAQKRPGLLEERHVHAVLAHLAVGSETNNFISLVREKYGLQIESPGDAQRMLSGRRPKGELNEKNPVDVPLLSNGGEKALQTINHFAAAIDEGRNTEQIRRPRKQEPLSSKEGEKRLPPSEPAFAADATVTENVEDVAASEQGSFAKISTTSEEDHLQHLNLAKLLDGRGIIEAHKEDAIEQWSLARKFNAHDGNKCHHSEAPEPLHERDDVRADSTPGSLAYTHIKRQGNTLQSCVLEMLLNAKAFKEADGLVRTAFGAHVVRAKGDIDARAWVAKAFLMMCGGDTSSKEVLESLRKVFYHKYHPAEEVFHALILKCREEKNVEYAREIWEHMKQCEFEPNRCVTPLSSSFTWLQVFTPRIPPFNPPQPFSSPPLLDSLQS